MFVFYPPVFSTVCLLHRNRDHGAGVTRSHRAWPLGFALNLSNWQWGGQETTPQQVTLPKTRSENRQDLRYCVQLELFPSFATGSGLLKQTLESCHDRDTVQ